MVQSSPIVFTAYKDTREMLTTHTQPNKLEKKDFIFNTLCQIKGSK